MGDRLQKNVCSLLCPLEQEGQEWKLRPGVPQMKCAKLNKSFLKDCVLPAHEKVAWVALPKVQPVHHTYRLINWLMSKLIWINVKSHFLRPLLALSANIGLHHFDPGEKRMGLFFFYCGRHKVWREKGEKHFFCFFFWGLFFSCCCWCRGQLMLKLYNSKTGLVSSCQPREVNIPFRGKKKTAAFCMMYAFIFFMALIANK